jgi:hypothetical protein
MPFAEQPEDLSRIVGAALAIENPVMLEVETGPDGRPWFIGFEWIGRVDYLNEANKDGQRVRGAHVTSADAVVRFRHQGRNETLLIEWKYTEKYGSPISSEGNSTRVGRYKDLAFAPAGPISSQVGLKLEDFFYEPFYQMLRQQMLAFEMQRAKEDDVDRVRVLHIAPAASRALRNVTSPALRRFGDDAFAVFQSILTRPEGFVSKSTESLFGPLLLELKSTSAWAAYLSKRYGFVTDEPETADYFNAR